MNKARVLSFLAVLAVLASMIGFAGVTPAYAYVTCSPGYYDASGGSLFNFTCTPASPGYYVEYSGAVSQTPCAIGTYQPNSAQTYCLNADAGYYVGGSASTLEAPCAAGTYQPYTGSSGCDTTQAGYYSGQAATQPTACTPGTFQPNPGSSNCFATDAGYYTAGSAATVETPCAAGFFQPLTGQSGCAEAYPGHYAAGTGNTAQTACALGTYQPLGGKTSCITAGVGYYVDTVGSAIETACPAGETSLAGSTSLSDCYWVDSTPPSASPSASPAANGAGWNNTSVTINWNWADNAGGSGVDPNNCTASTVVSTEGANQTINATCKDLAGNLGTATYTLSIDQTAPTIALNTPANGATFLLNQVVNADFSCTDSLSALASCVGSVLNGSAIDTSSVGSKSFSVNASDNAGNTSSASASYSVGYNFSGFLAPVNNPPTVNTGKAGRTYPVQWQLTDGNGAFISSLSAVTSVTYKSTSCSSFSGDSTDSLETSTSGSSGLHYDSTTNQFVYNWATPSAGCYTLFVKLASNQTFYAFFNLSK